MVVYWFFWTSLGALCSFVSGFELRQRFFSVGGLIKLESLLKNLDGYVSIFEFNFSCFLGFVILLKL